MGDSLFIFVLALMLFGPKKLPELARQLGKLMGELRRASNDFRMQMEDELRTSEQAERQKQIAAIEAAAPVQAVPEAEHPHLPPALAEPVAEAAVEPIATSGSITMMPPETGLPVSDGVRTSAAPAVTVSNGSSALSPLLSSIPAAPDPAGHENASEAAHQPEGEAVHG